MTENHGFGLTRAQVEAAVAYGREHPNEMQKEKWRGDLAFHKHCTEQLRTAIRWVGETWPECGEGTLTAPDDHVPRGTSALRYSEVYDENVRVQNEAVDSDNVLEDLGKEPLPEREGCEDSEG